MQDGAEAPVSGRRPGPGRMRWIVACLAALGGLLPAAAQGPPQEEAVTATTRYVDDNTCPATGAGTLANPYCRIQDAICASASGDTVSVAPGVYLEAVRMRPGVSLVSQGGPGVTTINAAGRPCTDSNFCTKRAGNQCSVVTFASGHTPSTVLDGFTLTGGAGLIQTVKVAGGGIFVFSSPTITNNVITGNILAGPRAEFTGAGIYSAVGQPIISGNVISGNQAVPPAGTSGNLTFAYGAGIAVGFNSSPTVTDNLIENNITGDEALAYSVGHGGGVSIWPGDSSQPGAVFDGNVIYGNVSDTTGGGLSLLTLPGTSAKVKVTNNVIDGNVSRTGGGVYIYQNTTDLINNTITGNDGNLGGGIYIAPSNSTLTVDISNDIIEGNTLRTFGNGGGIYTFDLTPGWDPLIRYNDFFGNNKNAIAGDRNDGNTIGVDGNFAADPLFVSKSTGDYHLQAGSPAVDKGLASVAPAVDFDNNPRGVDGDGTPNSPVAGDVDVGAFEFGAGCVPQPEVCDGVDNNCDDVVDEGFPDTDGDGMADCVDACPADPANDADGDGVCVTEDN